MNREDYELVETCNACPEQYDVFLGSQKVGYLRLRHGHFSAEYTPTGETVYSANPEGDGVFEPHERNRYLNDAVEAIDAAHHAVPVNPRGWSMR